MIAHLSRVQSKCFVTSGVAPFTEGYTCAHKRTEMTEMRNGITQLPNILKMG